MSIVTLKKKTMAKYNNMSANAPSGGFSLNGSFRGQGYVGQSTQSRTLVRSLAKGATLRGGHGGCCGKYVTAALIFPSELQHLDDANHIRPSSLTSKGQIATKYRWIGRPDPFSTVKRTGAEEALNSQSTYIQNLVKLQLNAMDQPGCRPEYVCRMPCRPIGAHSFRSKIPVYKAAADPVKLGAIPPSEYVRALNKACGLIDKEYKIRHPNQIPFACGPNEEN
jgi:hypothetical protein